MPKLQPGKHLGKSPTIDRSARYLARALTRKIGDLEKGLEKDPGIAHLGSVQRVTTVRRALKKVMGRGHTFHDRDGKGGSKTKYTLYKRPDGGEYSARGGFKRKLQKYQMNIEGWPHGFPKRPKDRNFKKGLKKFNIHITILRPPPPSIGRKE